MASGQSSLTAWPVFASFHSRSVLIPSPQTITLKVSTWIEDAFTAFNSSGMLPALDAVEQLLVVLRVLARRVDISPLQARCAELLQAARVALGAKWEVPINHPLVTREARLKQLQLVADLAWRKEVRLLFNARVEAAVAEMKAALAQGDLVRSDAPPAKCEAFTRLLVRAMRVLDIQFRSETSAANSGLARLNI